MKDLAYYMTLQYDIKVEELSDGDGGGIFVSIPLLGEMAVNAHGNTYEEARAELEDVKKDFFEMWLEAGVDIPEPKCEIQKTAIWIDKAKLRFRELGFVGA